MNKSILDKLMNTGVPIIKPGTIVKLSKTNEEVYIRTASIYPDNSVVYTGYIFKSENQRQELGALYPSEIRDYDKLLAVNLKTIEDNQSTVDINTIDALQNIYAELLSTRSAVYNKGVLFSTGGVLDKFNNAEEAYRNLMIRFELRTASSYGYIHSNLILPNDSYIVVYYRTNKQEAFIPVDYITRKVELKPFIKRVFTSLLYGRSHASNFKYIEDDKSYTNRVLEILSNQQKEKGYIQYNRAEVMI